MGFSELCSFLMPQGPALILSPFVKKRSQIPKWDPSVSFLVHCYSRAVPECPGKLPWFNSNLTDVFEPIAQGHLFLRLSLLCGHTSIFPGFQEHQPHGLPFHKLGLLPQRDVFIPSFPPVQEHSFPEVQPCSAGGDLFKRDALDLSKTITSRPGQNNK